MVVICEAQVAVAAAAAVDDDAAEDDTRPAVPVLVFAVISVRWGTFTFHTCRDTPFLAIW